jgi:hypothetical protein
MTYYESAKGITVTRERAIKEIKEHGLLDSINDFYDDYGKREQYEAQDVLNWLGY